MRTSIVLAIATVTAGQTIYEGRPDDMRLTWFESPNCVAYNGSDGGLELHNTGVVGGRSVCMRVPGVTDTSSYKVDCSIGADGAVLPRGSISFFSQVGCPDVSLVRAPTLFEDEACLANPILYGSASLQAQCLNPLLPPSNPLAGRATVAWSGAVCGVAADTAPRTLVDLRSGLCQTVPAAIPGGYRIDCAADGSFAVFSIFETNTCASLVNSRVLERDTCAPNDGVLFGSFSVTVRCSQDGLAGAPAAVRDQPPPSPLPVAPVGLGAPIPPTPSPTSSLPPGVTPSPSTPATNGVSLNAASTYATTAVLCALIILFAAA